MSTPPVPVTNRPAYEVLIDDFMVLDTECQQLLEKFLTGKILYECMPQEGGDLQSFMTKMSQNFVSFQEHLKKLIEKRNAKLQEAASSMRGAVMASDQTVRGPDGKSSFVKYGPFEVSSKTARSFSPETLISELQSRGLYSRLTDLNYIDQQTGNTEKAFKQEWVVKYEPVKNFLREMNLEDVLNAAYEEEEGTPAVTGPKELGWLGEASKKKGGKKGG